MFILSEGNGLQYISEKEHIYSIFKTVCIGTNRNPDIVIIFDDEQDKVVNFFYGASFPIEEEDIKYYVNEYEENGC